MCYNISYLTKKRLDYARRFGEEADALELERILNELYNKTGPVYYASGFDHPDVPVITNTEPHKIQLFSWGLIPFWVRDSKSALEISNRTINARGEDMFDKPSFKISARKKRCIVLVDGFFEYYWKENQSYPYFICLRNGEPMALAGLWDTWTHPVEKIIRNTFAVVTGSANALMSRIHNKPKASEGPRMPVILAGETESQWLTRDELGTDSDINSIKKLIRPFKEEMLEAYTVPKLKGRDGVGNTELAIRRQDYPELK